MVQITVIIPVYKVASVLPRCLDSLIAQTFSDWEAICVEDGSPDACGEILDAYAAKDSRFRILHKENAGVSQARNDALALAQGKYLLFVDADDFLHPQTMEICHYMAERDESDMVAFTYDRKFRTRLTFRHFLGLSEPKQFSFEKYTLEKLESCVTNDIFRYATEFSAYDKKRTPVEKRWVVKHCQPWRCLYRTERIRDIRFIPGIIYEDFPWWSLVMLAVRKTTILNLPLYYYYPNFGGYIHSASQQFRIESLKKAITVVEKQFADQASAYQYDRWRRNFLRPFEEKLEKKLKAYRPPVK